VFYEQKNGSGEWLRSRLFELDQLITGTTRLVRQ